MLSLQNTVRLDWIIFEVPFLFKNNPSNLFCMARAVLLVKETPEKPNCAAIVGTSETPYLNLKGRTQSLAVNLQRFSIQPSKTINPPSKHPAIPIHHSISTVKPNTIQTTHQSESQDDPLTAADFTGAATYRQFTDMFPDAPHSDILAAMQAPDFIAGIEILLNRKPGSASLNTAPNVSSSRKFRRMVRKVDLRELEDSLKNSGETPDYAVARKRVMRIQDDEDDDEEPRVKIHRVIRDDEDEPRIKKNRTAVIDSDDIIEIKSSPVIEKTVLSSPITGNSAPSSPITFKPTASQEQAIIFCNTAPDKLLNEVASFDASQVSKLRSLLPFTSYTDFLERCTDTRILRLVEKYTEVLSVYEEVDEVISKCENVGAEIGAIMDGWSACQLRGDAIEIKKQMDRNPGLIAQQPDSISKSYVLKGYQLKGISWLSLLYKSKLGGMLADEMGLGKTAQVISFIANLVSLNENGPHLIIVPSSTLSNAFFEVGNWMREIERWCPSLIAIEYSGSVEERREVQDSVYSGLKFNIILTTYNLATGSKEDRGFLRKLRCVSMILDEGHLMKNSDSQRYKYLMSFKSPFRLLLTGKFPFNQGTPLQNNLLELLSLLTFIMPDLFSANAETLQKLFSHKLSSNGDPVLHERIERAKRMMAPFILRRRKDEVLSDLPIKIHILEKCQQTTTQKKVYTDILVRNKKIGGVCQNGTKVAKKQTSVQSRKLTNVLMQLRKAANHPLLMRYLYDDSKLLKLAALLKREDQFIDSDVELIYEDLQVMSDFEIHNLCIKHGKIRPFQLKDDQLMDAGKITSLKTMLVAMKAKKDRILLFSQFVIMLDILERVMDTLNMKFIRLDGSTPLLDRQDLIDEFQGDDTITVFLLSTKAGGFGINLTAANVVILYDIDFNPHNDAQAEDRAHRVGQTRNVTVVRMITEGTVEEHIYNSARLKLDLDASVSMRNVAGKDEVVGSGILEMVERDISLAAQ